MRWLVSVAGFVLVCLGVFWSVQPPWDFAPIFLGAVVFLLGVGLIVTGFIWQRRSKEIGTMTIALGDEAEKEAEVLEQLQTAVRHHLNPDEVLPEQAHRKQADEKHFITLPKEERKLKKIHKKR